MKQIYKIERGPNNFGVFDTRIGYYQPENPVAVFKNYREAEICVEALNKGIKK